MKRPIAIASGELLNWLEATMLLSKGVEPIKVMKMGGWKDIETMMIYARKAGMDIRGATDCLNLHSEGAQILKLAKETAL